MTVKEWIEEEQGKHFCQCGCGEAITIKRQHHSNGIPEYIRGHGGHYNHSTMVDKWVEGERKKHFCQCGCGGEIKIIKKHHSKGIPKYITGHSNKGKKFPHAFSRVNNWVEKQQGGHFCQCGCNREITITDRHHYRGIPKYIYGHGNVGRKVSEETKEKTRQTLTGHSVSEETKQIIREKRKHQVFPTHHTKPELIFEEICKKYDLHFKYVGDSSLWIGKKNNSINPDFIQADGQKIVVEIFGEYWHSLLINPKLPKTANLDYRKKHYKKYGWVSYFIWDTDLLRHDAEQFVLNMLKGVGVPK